MVKTLVTKITIEWNIELIPTSTDGGKPETAARSDRG